ncbi:biliverdin-producing heme oxygenase [Flavobacterium akiainvivens]|uniref:biliverdin-producing heme oxygenase n=1 Tax=Flavobacterium akiainvivens TaxID=1202724 RepID=UPI0006C87E15|nr:biliverdin-producing heme oxygenase [Flavobacterium akiainvivens]SFQ42378.1 heme oxygenase [Flavobacterium akiainvivens]
MENTTTAPLFLENLRNLTAQSHTALEALPVSESVVNPAITNAEYANYLNLMHDVVKDVEENIFPLIATVITDLDARKKVAHIEADLAFLGHAKDGYQKVLTGNLQNITPAFALGVAYVVEGSTLGGRVILKNINTALGHDAENGAAFFSGYGGQTGSMWKGYLAPFTAFEAENNAGAEIIAGANHAYDAIAAHFGK